jgi:hypothetical protein
MKYRKKPVEIEAMQFTEENKHKVIDWLKDNKVDYSYDEINSGGELIIYSKSGPFQCPTDWWVIKGSTMFFICDDESFQSAYEEEENRGTDKTNN